MPRDVDTGRVATPADAAAAARRQAAAAGVAVGVLLAGGRGRRIGADKRYLVLEGRTLLQRNLAFLHDLFPTVAVSAAAGDEPDVGDATGVAILPDAFPGSSPLVGIATALRHYDAPVFVLAVDIAAPDARAAARVLAAFAGHDVSLPAIGPHLEPLFAAYGTRCLAPMRALLDAGRHRIVEAFSVLAVARVPFRDPAPFHNINTVEDFEKARSLAGADARPAPQRPARAPGRRADRARRTAQPALVAIVGKSGSGKTTLVERLIPELVALGLRVGSVKHDAHGFEIDHPGKDSWRHGQAGGEAYAIASPDRLAFVTRLSEELPVEEIARRFFAGFDIVVAEGYKGSAPYKVEVFRRGAGHREPLCAPGEALAVVTDADPDADPRPHLDTAPRPDLGAAPRRATDSARRFALDDAASLARFLAVRLDTLRRY